MLVSASLALQHNRLMDDPYLGKGRLFFFFSQIKPTIQAVCSGTSSWSILVHGMVLLGKKKKCNILLLLIDIQHNNIYIKVHSFLFPQDFLITLFHQTAKQHTWKWNTVKAVLIQSAWTMDVEVLTSVATWMHRTRQWERWLEPNATLWDITQFTPTWTRQRKTLTTAACLFSLSTRQKSGQKSFPEALQRSRLLKPPGVKLPRCPRKMPHCGGACWSPNRQPIVKWLPQRLREAVA